MNFFTIYTLPPLISSILFLSFGFFVYLNNRKSIVNITFFLLCFVTFWWQFSWFILFNTQSETLASYLVKIGYMGIIFIPIFFFHFFILFLKEVVRKIDKYLLYLSYFLAIVFEIFLINTNLFISGFYQYFWGFYPKAGILHPLYLLLLAILAGRGLYLLILSINRKIFTGHKHLQVKYLLLALIIYIFAASDFLANYGVEFYPLGPIFVLGFLGISTLAIARYHLFEIRVILTELLVTVMGIILLLLPFLMPTSPLKSLTFFTFVLFCLFGYYLVKATHEESKRREEAEALTIRERVLRGEAERLAEKERQVAEEFQVIAIQSMASKKRAEEFAEREKSLREKAEKLARDFQRLNEVRNQMFLTGHHHSRSPLAHIKNLSSMLLEKIYGAINKKQKWAVKTIFDKAQESIDLANLYLSVAELEAGKEVISKKKTKLEKIIRDQIKKLSYEAKLKNIEIITKIEKDLPEIQVDPEKIGVVYFTILDNGLKYSPQKGGKIVIGLNNTEKETILFSCQDNGIGIEKEEISNLGQVPYQRSERARGVHGTGKGLALYLSNLIVKAHQGKLWAESEGKGKGTTFYVELPIK